MIRTDDIKSILTEMASQIGVTFVREQQSTKIPDYPFVSYSVLSDTPVKLYQRFYATASGMSSGMSSVSHTEPTRSVISLNFYDRNATDKISSLAAKSQQWFGSSSGINFCCANGYSVNYNGSVQNRTVFIEDYYWESRLGYDLNFDTANVATETLSKMNEVDIKQTAGSVQLPEIIIP